MLTGSCRPTTQSEPSGLDAEGHDGAAEGDDAALDPGLTHGAHGVHGGTAARDGGEGELHPGGHSEEVGVGLGHGGDVDGGEVHVLEQAVYLALAGDLVEPVDEAPGLDEGVNGEVERAVRGVVDCAGGLEHLGDLAGDDYAVAGGGVDVVEGAPSRSGSREASRAEMTEAAELSPASAFLP